MDRGHRARITGGMREALGDTPLHVLDIPDDYQFLDPELVDVIRDRVEWHFRNLPAQSD